MKLLMAQLNPVIGDLDGNTHKIIQTFDKARAEGADIVLFPELTICGYPPDDLVYHAAFIDSMEQHLHSIVKASHGLMAFVGLARRNVGPGEKPLLNSAAVMLDGSLLGFQDKWLLPNYDVFDERRYFEPGLGTRVWSYKGKRIGVVICEDIWQHAGYIDYSRYGRDPIVELAAHKPDLLVNLTASPYQFEKPDVRVKVCAKAAKTLDCPVALCCQVGANGQIVCDGYSIFVDKTGCLSHMAKGFEEDFMMVDLENHECQQRVEIDSREDLYRALVLGVKDYFKKCGFKTAILGISGGIDSALVACIAKDALGAENVTGVTLPSEYSSEETQADAKKVAENLGIHFEAIPIKEVFEAQKKLLEPYFGGKAEDITEENLQARIRGMMLMALANKHGHLLLSTGNKSESAIGYMTLYGDMCGGLGVISDVPKTMVYDLARWYNRNEEIIPQTTIDRPPTAELKPGQIDLDTLPEYGIVDNVVSEYVQSYMSVSEIAEKYGYPLEVVMDLVHRIHLSEFKRRQSAPTLRVTKKSFGVGRRYPLVQGWR
ncbi:MAG: Glutamine-dependent NAD(+) synthetase [Chlamydiia bacterium]|nr:Glutamine-dependent NAD(+) synthetase [Chlamydiia bacterium]MCH9614959.1 Glutamine-dependent NAD(+) synthetase [Chlamydiia bacterium]MCH9629991.1 Glutamine-dependent NAD(+) synthetase [Chlamydiia bacterium]